MKSNGNVELETNLEMAFGKGSILEAGNLIKHFKNPLDKESRYQIFECLGSGANGAVYRVKQLTTEKM